jgi:glycosyltransferase involved in cell wall biosynthesis
MAKPAPPRDAVSVALPVHNAADRVAKVVPAWADFLARLGRGYELLVVDDGSTDGTAAALEPLAGRLNYLRVLKHDTRRGFGASIRTALAEAQHPLFFYTAADYPYTPADLRKLLDRIEVRDEFFGKQPDLISGCRTGRPTPPLVNWGDRAWRLFWRLALGLPMEPSSSWLGGREWAYGTFVRWVFGVPLADVNSGFKLYRTAFLKRFPIQSDGDFVHTELVAKATFLTSIMDEVPLTPKPDPEPLPPSRLREMWRVFCEPEFGNPVAPAIGEPGTAADGVQAPVEGSRGLTSPDTPGGPTPSGEPGPTP